MGRLVIGVNDLETWCNQNNRLDLLEDWNHARNNGLTPKMVSANTKEVVFWKCSQCGHEWTCAVQVRKNGRLCPNCSHAIRSEIVRKRKLGDGENSIANKKPLLAEQWDYEANGDLKPIDVSAQSHSYAYWICEKGHKYKARIQNRMLGSGCPYCSGRKVLVGVNDLQTTNPNTLDEWDYVKNSVLPTEVSAGSEIKVYWICSEGHSYQQMIANHVKGHGCPICAGKLTVAGINDLATLYPEIAKEWDYDKNKSSPDQIAPHSQKAAWWICPKGHSYRMVIGSRTGSKPQGCSVCAKEKKTSFSEQAVFYYVHLVFEDAINGYKDKRTELDIFIPSIKTAIEYDGLFWHNNHKSLLKDNRKDQYCIDNRINLYRFRDPALPNTLLAKRITCKDGNNKSLESGIKQLFRYLGVSCPSINIRRDTTLIMDSYVFNEKQNSLAEKFPRLAEEWNYEKNKGITPYSIAWGSAKDVWWKCSICNTEWLCSPAERTGGNYRKCPNCTKREVVRSKFSPVMNIDTGEVFDSLTDAAKSCNGRVGDISAVCRGYQTTAFGYRWQYLGEPKNRE